MTSRLRPAVVRVLPWLRSGARVTRRAAEPLVSRVQPRVAPITEAIARAVDEGTAAPAPRRPATARDLAGDLVGDRPSDEADPEGPENPAEVGSNADAAREALRFVSSVPVPVPGRTGQVGRAVTAPAAARR